MVDDSSSVRLVVVEIEGGGTTSGVTPGTSNKRLLPIVDSLVLCAYPISPLHSLCLLSKAVCAKIIAWFIALGIGGTALVVI